MTNNLYAVDGQCHNAEAGTYGHECGKPATWLGTTKSGFTSGYCDDCKAHGREARDVTTWRRRPAPRGYIVAGKHRRQTFESANLCARHIYERTGAVVSIEMA